MLYNRTLKIVDKKPNQWHHCHILKQWHMLNLTNVKNVSYVKLIFKCLRNKAPSVLCNLVKRHDAIGQITRSTEVGNCRSGFCRTSQGQRAFSVKGSQLWNMLPNEFKVIHDIKSFTLMVKRWLKVNQTCMHI